MWPPAVVMYTSFDINVRSDNDKQEGDVEVDAVHAVGGIGGMLVAPRGANSSRISALSVTTSFSDVCSTGTPASNWRSGGPLYGPPGGRLRALEAESPIGDADDVEHGVGCPHLAASVGKEESEVM